MPPKPEAKAKAEAVFAASRRPTTPKRPSTGSARPNSARPARPSTPVKGARPQTAREKKTGKKVVNSLAVENVVAEPVKLRDVQRVSGVEFIGAQYLSRILLESILTLPQLQGCEQIFLHRVSVYQKAEKLPMSTPSLTPRASKNPSNPPPPPQRSASKDPKRSERSASNAGPVLGMTAPVTLSDMVEQDLPSLWVVLGVGLEPCKPFLLRMAPQELLEEEMQLAPIFEAYGAWAPELGEPEIIATMHKHSFLVMPLIGGQCLLPPLALEPVLENIQCFTQSFADAQTANDGMEVPAAVSRALRATQHVCCSILLQPMQSGSEQEVNLSQVFRNIEDLILGGSHPELGVDFFDGNGSNAVGFEKEQIEELRGGPLSDGVPINELNKMVLELVPGLKQTRPSQFLAWFHWQMRQSGSRWHLKAFFSESAAPIDFDAVLQDDGHAWLVPCSANAQFPNLATLRDIDTEDLNQRHLFSRLARWMMSGILLHTPIQSAHDQKYLRELLMILACVPEDLGLSPPPPPDGSRHLRFAWSFARRCLRCLRWHHPMMHQGKLITLPQAGLQLTWALLDASVEMVPAEHTRHYPERKRLALFAALCFAIRLTVESKKMEEPVWLAEKMKLWGHFEDVCDLEGLEAKIHCLRSCMRESWTVDVVQRMRSVFQDELPYEVLPLNVVEVKTQKLPPETTEDVEILEVEEPSVAMTAWKSLEHTMGRQLSKAWEHHQRFFITGGVGGGKRAVSRSIMADLTLGDICSGQAPRFPVRMKFSELQLERGDAVQEFLSSDVAAGASAWERQVPPPWQGRHGHQVTAMEGKIVVTGGISTQTGKATQEVWVYDGHWEELPTAQWCARSEHQVVYWEDRLVLLGGVSEEGRHLRDAWTSSDGGNSWQELPCPRWSGRSGHQALVVSLAVKAPARPMLVLMGGCAAGNKPLKDVWASDTGGYSWTELEALPCSARWNFHALALAGSLWITGGEDERHRLNDCWQLKGNAWNPKGGGTTVTRVKSDFTRAKSEDQDDDGWRGPLIAAWPARAKHQAIPFRGQLAIFGGSGEKNQVLCDAWVSEDCVSWRSLPYHAWAQASGRAGHKALTLPDGRSLVFGGLGGGRDILLSRLLAVVIEEVPRQLPTHEVAVIYFERLMKERHLVMLVSTMDRLEPDEGEEPSEIYALLQRWNFCELRVKPLETSHLQTLCRRWTHSAELPQLQPLQEQVEAEMLLPDNYELVKTPLTALMVLRALAPRDQMMFRMMVRRPSSSSVGVQRRPSSSGLQRRPSSSQVQPTPRMKLTRCQLYEHMFKRLFQSHAAVKAYDDSEFNVLMKQGLVTACAELAFEGLGKRSRHLKAHELQTLMTSNAKLAEPLERLVKTVQAGQLLLLEDQNGGLKFRYPSMQDYLAAQCAWQHLLEGKGLPQWLIQENAAGNVSEEVSSCAKFFCLQAEGRDPLRRELLLDLREGLAFLLQMMCKAGNALAIRCLLDVAPTNGRQQLMAMHSQAGSSATGLHLAAVHGHEEVVETLLALAPDPQQLCLAMNADGMTPLHCAARDGHEATARALLCRAPDGFAQLQTPQKSSSALRPLHLAAKNGHVDVVKCFLEFAPIPAAICIEANSEGNTALHFAAAGGHTATTHAILTHAGPANEMQDRATLLLTAVNRFDRQTALHLASDRGENDVVEILLQAAPDRSMLMSMSDKLGQTALHLACERGHASVVQKLLQWGDHHLVSARERITGQTALHMAAESGNSQAVLAILEASPYRKTSLATDKGGRNTALHLAAERGHLETVKTLLAHCPDMEALLLAKEKFAHHTALHLAAGAGHATLCETLLELAHGCLPTLLGAKDKSGDFTPLLLACEKGHAKVVEVLLEGDPEKGERLTQTLEKWSGFSALHLVAYRGHEETAQVMLRLAPDKRALLELKDQRGRTAGDLAAWAVERGRRPVPTLLAETQLLT